MQSVIMTQFNRWQMHVSEPPQACFIESHDRSIATTVTGHLCKVLNFDHLRISRVVMFRLYFYPVLLSNGPSANALNNTTLLTLVLVAACVLVSRTAVHGKPAVNQTCHPRRSPIPYCTAGGVWRWKTQPGVLVLAVLSHHSFLLYTMCTRRAAPPTDPLVHRQTLWQFHHSGPSEMCVPINGI